MHHHRRYRQSNPQPRNITVKYAGKCACCGATIQLGEWATYYPAGTIAGRTEPAIAHCGGLDGTSQRCFVELRRKHTGQPENAYAGDGLDARYEDDCRDACGL